MTGIASFVILSEAKDLDVALSCGIEGSVLPYISMHPTTFREEPKNRDSSPVKENRHLSVAVF